jgi:hypothetical protein
MRLVVSRETTPTPTAIREEGRAPEAVAHISAVLDAHIEEQNAQNGGGDERQNAQSGAAK